MKRLYIVDPSLSDLRGHHYALTRAATLSAQSLGFAVHWLCSAQYSGALSIDGVTIDPAFRSTMYDRYMMKAPESRMASKLRSLLDRFALRREKLSPEEGFRQDLQSALARQGADAQDRIFIHTADGVIFRSIAGLLLGSNGAELPVLHVATPYNPTGVMPNKGAPEEISTAILALREKNLIDSKIFLYGENDQLATHLAANWSVPVRSLDLPVKPRETYKIQRAQAYRQGRLGLADDAFLVVSLGSARLEKGFDLFPDIIGHVFALAGNAEFPDVDPTKIKFVLHASPQIIGRHPDIAAAIEKLTAMESEHVELILDPLSDIDYENLLQASDAVMMPYSEKDYGIRGSMIVSEAIAAAKPIIATVGTYPGYAAAETHGRTAGSPQEFAESLLAIISDREASRERIERASDEFAARNSVEGYWQKCLNAEGAGIL
jgi:glycosyltransferase involved in cell wall biosynthesis